MTEPTPSALVEALEREANTCMWEGHAELLRAAAAFIRSTMEAVADADTKIAECPFTRPGYSATKCKRCGATASDGCGVHDNATNQLYRRLRTLTGATDER